MKTFRQKIRIEIMTKINPSDMFNSKVDALKCPYGSCEGAPHLISTMVGRFEQSASGDGLEVEWYCESGHHWKLTFTDHNGGTWLGIVQLPTMQSTLYEMLKKGNP